MLKRMALWLAVLGVALLLALNVARSGRYGAMVAEVDALEAEQQAWLENNRRLIAAIAELEAPQRVEEEARGSLGMERARADDVLRVELGAGDGTGDGR